MVAAITKRTHLVKPSASQDAASLRVVPLTGPSCQDPVYVLLTSENLDRVVVSEKSEGGEVPTLIVENQLDVMVFLMDGQELVGAKQNRILNADVLVPANSRIEIPVSCVEQGRWQYRSRRFSAGKSASHRTRSEKMKRVRESLAQQKGHDANQGKVWQEVHESMICAQACSPTGALSDAYAAQQQTFDETRKGLELPEDAVGVATFSGSDLLGLDLFDRHTTCKHYWSNLVDSYLIDHMRQPMAVDKPSQSDSQVIRQYLDRLDESSWHTFEAPGLGDDYRFSESGIEASALVWNDEVPIHVQLFPTNNAQARDRTDP